MYQNKFLCCGDVVINKIIRLLNTLKYLKFTQLLFYILRRRFSLAVVVYDDYPDICDTFSLDSPLLVNGLWKNNRFKFLNITKAFTATNINWHPNDVPRLWRYNLHYFDYLRETGCSGDKNIYLLESWIVNNPQGCQPGWEPFTASLRIVNWIFYLQKNPFSQTADILQSLYTQVLWLEKNDEKHILANHYFENLKALTFAGVFFTGVDAERWLKKGTKGLHKQLLEQTLADGGHYERSPQYHGLMLENHLDIYNLAKHNKHCFDSLFVEDFQQHCIRGLRFYQSILFPDLQPPLFNDTAFAISPSLIKLNSYYQRLTLGSGCLTDAEALICNKESGFFGYRHHNDMVIIKAGSIGPSYQPGHNHCDMLSYELMLNGQRVVVDTGVFEYEPGEMRTFVRSTKAHNTVSIDGTEQSEIWGEFRFARRARDVKGKIEQISAKHWVFDGEFRGFYAVKGQVKHRRQVSVQLDDNEEISQLIVTDWLVGSGLHTVENFIHLHPEVIINDSQNGKILLCVGDEVCATLKIHASLPYRVEKSFYCPEFGKKIENTVIVIFHKSVFPFEMKYQLDIT